MPGAGHVSLAERSQETETLLNRLTRGEPVKQFADLPEQVQHCATFGIAAPYCRQSLASCEVLAVCSEAYGTSDHCHTGHSTFDMSTTAYWGSGLVSPWRFARLYALTPMP